MFWQKCGAGLSLSAVSYCRGAVPFDLGWTVYSHSSIGYYVYMRELTVLCALKLDSSNITLKMKTDQRNKGRTAGKDCSCLHSENILLAGTVVPDVIYLLYY